jgi:cysteine-S-conjugate beta-lyase
MVFDFDSVIDRRGTFSIKWDDPRNGPGLAPIIPLWVADMDFAPPPAVLEAIRARAGHPVFGYTRQPREYHEAVAAWYKARQGISLASEEILMAPAVMPAIAAAIHAFTAVGEGVMILPPVYHPFRAIVEDNGRVPVAAPLALSDAGTWAMDFEAMARAAAEAEAAGTRLRAILVSSPHNPVGRVWTEGELGLLLDFASDRGLVLLCDEIHSDIVLGQRPFASLARIEGERARGLVVFSGPNKTFNIAGLHICQAIARHEPTRESMRRALSAGGFGPPNAISLAAALAAYREGGPWLDELLAYLSANNGFLSGFLASRLPEVLASPLEGSYLAWLDFRAVLERLGLDDTRLEKKLEEEGRVRLSPGSGFGAEGRGWMRLNLACPRSLLEEGLERAARVIA